MRAEARPCASPEVVVFHNCLEDLFVRSPDTNQRAKQPRRRSGGMSGIRRTSAMVLGRDRARQLGCQKKERDEAADHDDLGPPIARRARARSRAALR
jgi:hypothetical protein